MPLPRVWHAVGTASVSPRGAVWGVLDPDLTVKKTIGLSVVDAAAIPYVPTAHTQGPIYLWAERAADVIKARGRE
jgi:choline dehydrogenase-like flavoprotein